MLGHYRLQKNFQTTLQLIKKISCSTYDFIFPPNCLLCKKLFFSSQKIELCENCINNFNFFNNSPKCRKCGIVFNSPVTTDHLCSRCFKEKIFFDKARAIGVFDGALRKAVHLLKYSPRPRIAASLGRLMAQQGKEIMDIKGYDWIIPVPLHEIRLRQRGFNQALLLARQVGKTWGVPVKAEYLKRALQTETQTTMLRQSRYRNVRNAFNCTAEYGGEKNILIIDDVFTTGATVNECARVLKKHGAKRVEVLTLARTL